MNRLFARLLSLALLAVWSPGCTSTAPINCPDGTQHRRAKLDGRTADLCVSAVQKVHGPVVWWHDGDRKAAAGHYENGIPSGEFSQWSEDGRLLGSYTMSAGTGTLVRWHDNGAKAEETEYLDNAPHGRSTTWHPNGKKQAEGAYDGGTKHGPWRSWSADGAEDQTEEYDHGELVSPSRA